MIGIITTTSMLTLTLNSQRHTWNRCINCKSCVHDPWKDVFIHLTYTWPPWQKKNVGCVIFAWTNTKRANDITTNKLKTHRRQGLKYKQNKSQRQNTTGEGRQKHKLISWTESSMRENTKTGNKNRHTATLRVKSYSK